MKDEWQRHWKAQWKEHWRAQKERWKAQQQHWKGQQENWKAQQPDWDAYAKEQEERWKQEEQRWEDYGQQKKEQIEQHWKERAEHWQAHWQEHWKAHLEDHGPPWWHRQWHRRHQHLHHWPPRRWREYYGARLHRRIFLWFGATILFTTMLVGMVARFTRGPGEHPPRLLLIGIPALVIFILSGKIARRITRPLQELSEVAAAIGRGKLEARAGAACQGYDEVGRLGRAVNDMAERIGRQLNGQRELLAAVSHELRTPLARLRVLLDIARERGATAETYAEWERELIEMDRLVGELLASSRLDFQALTRSPLEAVEVARRALERAGEPADRLAAATPTIPLAADPTLLARALANLLDNARRHGRGLTRLGVEAHAGLVRFVVEDSGPGIPAALAERVFQPFVQVPSDGPPPELDPRAHASLGLGLALVARIARAHGGRVFCDSQQGRVGARLVLELPAAAADAPVSA